jgi:hypothetical protein
MSSSQSPLEELVLSLFTRVSLAIIQGSSHPIPFHSHDPGTLNSRPVSKNNHGQGNSSKGSSSSSASSPMEQMLKGLMTPASYSASHVHVPHSRATHTTVNTHEACELVLDILVSGSPPADAELVDCVLVER